MGLKLGRWHLSLAIVFLFLGFLLSTAFTTQQRQGERSGPRKQNLVDFIGKQKNEHKKLGDQLIELRKSVEKFDSERAGRLGEQAVYARELERLRMRAGLKSVTGPGIEITLGDAPKSRMPLSVDPDGSLIHDYDLQIIVNALWRGGAEAIAINGERFVATTGIRSAGSTILINFNPQGGPYRIKAIGSSKKLEKSLKTDSDAALLMGDYAQKYGLITKVALLNKVTIPPYKGSLSLQLLRRE